MSPQLQLWWSPDACSLAVHITLREAGLDFKSNRVQSGTIPKDFHSINPKMCIPVLKIDDETITEVPAILTAISMLAPQLHLLGSNGIETVRAYEWMNWLSGTLHTQAFGAIFRPRRFTVEPEMDESLKKQGWITAYACYSVIEDRLEGIYSVGQSFTVVDAYLLVFWRWGKRFGIEMEETYPKYSALAKAVSMRDSTRAAMEIEGIAVY